MSNTRKARSSKPSDGRQDRPRDTPRGFFFSRNGKRGEKTPYDPDGGEQMTDTITIRKSRANDLAAADALFARSYPALLKKDYPPSVLVLCLPLISKAQPKLLSSGTYYVAETEDGRLVGAGGWSRRGRSEVAQIRHVVTDQDFTRRGIGRTLMDHVFDTARVAGVRHLQCQSTRTAVPFYAACGFAELGPIEVSLAPGIGFPAVAMERSI